MKKTPWIIALAFGLSFAVGASTRTATLPSYDPSSDVGKIPVIGSSGYVGWTTATGATGAVVGPSSSTSGDLVMFGGTTGRTLSDSGILYSNVAFGATASSVTANDLVAYAGTGGRQTKDSGIPLANVVLVSRAVQAGTGLTVTNSGLLSADITMSVGPNQLQLAMLPTGTSGIAVLGITGATGTNYSAISADTDGYALRRSGSALGFGTLATAAHADASITYAKIQNVAGLSLVGRSANSSGVAADITGADGNVCRVSGTTLGFGRIAMAGLPTGTSATSVIGITGATGIDYSAISAAADGNVLRRASSVLGFGTVNLSDSTNAVSGVLPIGVGGTSASTAASGYANLSPLTTKGDLVSYSTSPQRVAVGGNGAFLQADSTATTGVSWLASSYADWSKQSNQSLTNVTWTNINWDTALNADGASNITLASNVSGPTGTRFTVAAAGLYHFAGVMNFASSSAGGRRYVALEKNTNGTEISTAAIGRAVAFPVNGDVTGVPFSWYAKLSANDYIEVWCLQDSGGALNMTGATAIGSRMQVRRVGSQ